MAPKNIILCSDGTGNTAIKDRGTNVFKLYEAIDLHGHADDPTLPRQIAFYDDGCGSQGWGPIPMLKQAVGWGLGHSVKDLYAHLVRSYEPGDRIYLFGFSRGAFTIRTLADFIGACGILKYENRDDLWDDIRKAYELYRQRYQTRLNRRLVGHCDNAQCQVFCEERTEHWPSIEFVGVWDTVDAVGLPVEEMSNFYNDYIHRFKFPDHVLGEHVKRACQALAIDDERQPFNPVLWEHDERIEQVWFPGVHANVGGGYPKQGMSLVSLYWMLTRAAEQGLRFLESDLQYYREHRNVDDKLYDPREGWGAYYRYQPRDIGTLCTKHRAPVKVHVSAVERIIKRTDGYAPGNLPKIHEIVATDPLPVGVLDELKTTINHALGEKRTLLDDVDGLIRTRRRRHYNRMFVLCLSFFAAITLTIHYLLLPEVPVPGHNLFTKEGLLDQSAHLPALVPTVLLLGWVGVARLRTSPKQAMHRHFAKFWNELGPKLKTTLHD